MPFVSDASNLRTIHTDYHTPVILELGTEDGQPAARLIRIDGSYVQLTPEQRTKLEMTILEIENRAEAEKYAAIEPFLDGTLDVTSGKFSSDGTRSPDTDVADAMQFFLLEDGEMREVRPFPLE
ncbi:hypothetical protein [Nocardia noduli]|uniref:hypothetical protein n=1 Tax=Nocardia noduli TaxID=2815722 RepID=UPI001C2391EC|nr:hypothetical protein [Nocardia noduli]